MKLRTWAVLGLTTGVMTGVAYDTLNDLQKQKLKRHLRKYKYYYLAGGAGVAAGVIIGVKVSKRSDPRDLGNGLREIGDDSMALVSNPHIGFYAFGKDADVRLLMSDKYAEAYNHAADTFEASSATRVPGTKLFVSVGDFGGENKANVDIFNRVGRMINEAVRHLGPLPMGTEYDRLVEV